MPNPAAAAFILTCPRCGRRSQPDHRRPKAQYRCPDDGTILGPGTPRDAASPPTLRAVAPPPAASAKYETRGLLGRGGMAQVLKVYDRELQREVAMKVLSPQGGLTEEARRRFVHEAQATGQLQHPNVVPVHEIGQDAQGRPYFTLKRVDGESLKTVLTACAEGRRLPDGTPYREAYSGTRLLEILVSVCQGVAYAHSRGVLHRDLKPDNVMLGPFGEVVVVDWGLAKVMGAADAGVDAGRVVTDRAAEADATSHGTIAGTPAYMPPEQAAGKVAELDERADVYALGAILYEMLAGRPPYRGDGALDVVRQVVAGPPAPPEGAGTVPATRELRGVCLKAMARAREQRYASVAAFREDVRACLENRPVSAAPDLPWQRAARWARRNRRNVGVAAASAAAVTLLAGAGLWTQRHLALRGLIADASQALRKAQAAPARARDGEAQAAQRSLLFQAIDPLRRALERAPRNRAARGLLAEANMELWRLSLAEGNAGLMRTARAEVERYAPSPSPYRDELEGKGSLELALSPPETQAWLFRFETLSARTVSGRLLPARLVPVPYDHGHGRADAAFLQQEERRDEQPLPPGARSVYRLEPTAASHLGSGRIQVSALAPGSYLLLLRGQGVETRVPLVMPRGGRVVRAVAVPPPAAVPDGFVFVAGGEAVVGGDTAGAPPPHTVRVAPALLARAEVSMGEYAAFLADLVRLGRRDEAHARLPRDFGVGLQRVVRTAALTSAGRLVPEGAAPAAAEAYAASPARGVSHGDATAYVRWRSGRDGLPYRLPREWEWEAGCRGADGRRYAWGDRAGPGAASQGYGGGAGTGWSWRDRKDESPWGLLNMAGGVGEWTSSPYDTQAVPGQPAYGQLAIRGNAWSLSPVGLECAFRTSGRPDYFHPTIGFRLALDYPPGGAAR